MARLDGHPSPGREVRRTLITRQNHPTCDAEMSGLTKKAVYADKLLSSILGVREGDFVSYADISRGLHRYIKDNKLKGGGAIQLPKQPTVQAVQGEIEAAVESGMKSCIDCGAQIPSEATFCDMCGVSQ